MPGNLRENKAPLALSRTKKMARQTPGGGSVRLAGRGKLISDQIENGFEHFGRNYALAHI